MKGLFDHKSVMQMFVGLTTEVMNYLEDSPHHGRTENNGRQLINDKIP